MSGTMQDRPPPGRRAGQGDQSEAAEFILLSLKPLAQMASHHNLTTLGYLLDMAMMEADDTLKLLRKRSTEA